MNIYCNAFLGLKPEASLLIDCFDTEVCFWFSYIVCSAFCTVLATVSASVTYLLSVDSSFILLFAAFLLMSSLRSHFSQQARGYENQIQNSKTVDCGLIDLSA